MTWINCMIFIVYLTPVILISNISNILLFTNQNILLRLFTFQGKISMSSICSQQLSTRDQFNKSKQRLLTHRLKYFFFAVDNVNKKQRLSICIVFDVYNEWQIDVNNVNYWLRQCLECFQCLPFMQLTPSEINGFICTQ